VEEKVAEITWYCDKCGGYENVDVYEDTVLPMCENCGENAEWDWIVYEAAVDRVIGTPLEEYWDEIIDYDWKKGLEHFLWVATAGEGEILDWAQMIREDTNGDL